LDYLTLANFLTGVTLTASAMGPLTIAYSVNISRIRNLSYLLSTFLIVHGANHLAMGFGYNWIAQEILEPASVFAVIAFAIYLYETTFPISRFNAKSSAIPASSAAAFGALLVLPATTGPDITAIALFVAYAIFILMVAKNPSIRSLHFQFAIFLSIWSVSEAIFSFGQMGLNLGPLNDPNVGIWIHFASMVALGVFVNYRFFGIWRGVKNLRMIVTSGAKI
jgi:hypothetical protein